MQYQSWPVDIQGCCQYQLCWVLKAGWCVLHCGSLSSYSYRKIVTMLFIVVSFNYGEIESRVKGEGQHVPADTMHNFSDKILLIRWLWVAKCCASYSKYAIEVVQGYTTVFLIFIIPKWAVDWHERSWCFFTSSKLQDIYIYIYVTARKKFLQHELVHAVSDDKRWNSMVTIQHATWW